MKQILWSLIVLVLTQDVFAMNDEDLNMSKVFHIKEKLKTFDGMTLDEKQGLLIESLNARRESKQNAYFFICIKLGTPLPEYETFDYKLKSFSLETHLTFSKKCLPIKEICPEDIKSLIKHAVNQTALDTFRAKLSKQTMCYISGTEYEEDLQNFSHDLFQHIYSSNEKYIKYKILMKKQMMRSVSLLLENEPLEFLLSKVDYIKNKRKEIKKSLGEVHLSNLECLEKTLIKNQNIYCNDKCQLKIFHDFSHESLFDFYKTNIIKCSELEGMAFIINQEYTKILQKTMAPPQRSDPQPKRTVTLQHQTLQRFKIETSQDRLRKKLEHRTQQSTTENVKTNDVAQKQILITNCEKEIRSLDKRKNPQGKKKNNTQPQHQKNGKSEGKKKIQTHNPLKKKEELQKTTLIKEEMKTEAVKKDPLHITYVNGVMAVVGHEEPYTPTNYKKMPNNVPQIQRESYTKKNGTINNSQNNVTPTPKKLLDPIEPIIQISSSSMAETRSYSDVLKNVNSGQISNSSVKNKKISQPQQKPEEGGKTEMTNTAIPLNDEKQSEIPVMEQKQPCPPLVFGSNNFTIDDPSTIAHIIVQGKTAHFYTHDYVKLSLLLEELHNERDADKRSRTAAEEELKALKQSSIPSEMEKKDIDPIIKISSLPVNEGLDTKESLSPVFFESKKFTIDETSILKSIISEEKIAYFYKHDQMELDTLQKRLLRDRDRERHLKNVAEEELAAYKQFQ